MDCTKDTNLREKTQKNEQRENGKDIQKKFRKTTKRDSLSSKLRRVLVGIVFILLLTSLISITVIMRKERRSYAIRESEGILTGLTNNIFSEIERYKELSRLVMVEEKLVVFLRAKSKDVNVGMINEARYGIMNILNVTENVDSVFIFREDGQYLSTALPSNRNAYRVDQEKMGEDAWREKIVSIKGNAVISVNGDQALFRTNHKPLITISRAIYDLLTQKRTGIMMMNISDSLLERMVSEEMRDRLCIMGTDGTFLAGNEELTNDYMTEFESQTPVHRIVAKGTRRVMISGRQVEGMPIVIMYASEMDGGTVHLETVYLFGGILVIFLISVAIAGIFIAKYITGPVFRLANAMEENRQEGKLEKIDAGMPPNELGMLEEGYNNMIEHVNELIGRLIEKEKTLQKAEMRVLHEQIKPHFLYNSLETIGYLAMDAGAENVYTALETLGSFYRNFLSKGDKEIPLKREICIIQDYLSLQKLRYGEILHDEYDIAEDTENCIIPKLILQPLVENSIYHGIRLKGEEGTIKISSRLENDELHIIVRDTGVGMEQEMIDQMLAAGNTDGKKREELSESFGLWGTIERIRCFCDKEDVVQIRSEVGEYTEIEFILPLRHEGRREENVQSDDH